MKSIRTVIADDHRLLRAGFRRLLESIPYVEVVAEAGTGREAIEMVKAKLPDVVLLDIGMAELNGLEALSRIVRDFPLVKVIILSAHSNEEYVIRALRSGASGYMLKDAAAAELELAILAVTQRKFYLSSSISRTVLESYVERGYDYQSPLDRLTSRHREILQMIAEGKNAKEIAFLLSLSPKTVEAHRLQLMKRLDIHDVPGLVRCAIRSGLVSLEA